MNVDAIRSKTFDQESAAKNKARPSKPSKSFPLKIGKWTVFTSRVHSCLPLASEWPTVARCSGSGDNPLLFNISGSSTVNIAL